MGVILVIILVIILIGLFYSFMDYTFTKHRAIWKFIISWCGTISIACLLIYIYKLLDALDHPANYGRRSVPGKIYLILFAFFGTLSNFKNMVIIMGEAEIRDNIPLKILGFICAIASLFPPTLIMVNLIKEHFYPQYLTEEERIKLRKG